MLIVIHDSILNNLTELTESNDILIDALENIALGRREGKLLLFSTLTTMKQLSECQKLSSKARSVFLKIYNKLPTKIGYLELFARRVELVAEQIHLSSRTEGNKKIIVVPFRYFSDSTIIQHPIILCEDISDVLFYKRIAAVWLLSRKIRGVLVKCEASNGGGSGIGEVYKYIQNNVNRFCFCIVDSDMKAPNTENGLTANSVIGADDDTKVLSEYYLLKFREIENLIPTTIYSDLSIRQPDRMKIVAFLEKIEEVSPQIRQFLDLKEGQRLKGLKKNDRVWRFWSQWIKKHGELCASIKSDCINNPCNNCIKCQSIISNGFGKNIMDEVLSLLEKQSDHCVAASLASPISTESDIVGNLIVSWCCGSSIISTS